MTKPHRVDVDAWTLRCIFNWSRILRRCSKGEFTVTRKIGKNTSTRPNHPQDTRSHWLTFFDADGDEVATAHHYVCPQGDVTPPDPKSLKIGEKRYVEHPDRAIRNPEERYERIWQRKLYGFAMKMKCLLAGPVDRLP